MRWQYLPVVPHQAPDAFGNPVGRVHRQIATAPQAHGRLFVAEAVSHRYRRQVL